MTSRTVEIRKFLCWNFPVFFGMLRMCWSSLFGGFYELAIIIIIIIMNFLLGFTVSIIICRAVNVLEVSQFTHRTDTFVL